MTGARDSILGAIRKSLRRSSNDAADVAREAQAILGEARRFQPKFDDQSNRARFIARATSERLTATVDEVGEIGDAPAAVRAYLERLNLPLSIARPPNPTLHGLDWSGIETHEALTPNEPVGVNLADYAIAETGTLVFTSRKESPTLFNYLPLHHIILVDGVNILRHPEEYWAKVRAAGNVQPRSINFVTGTSGTADIEGQNIRGAHGPRFMHIIIYGERET